MKAMLDFWNSPEDQKARKFRTEANFIIAVEAVDRRSGGIAASSGGKVPLRSKCGQGVPTATSIESSNSRLNLGRA
jgi:hypothetical protein